MSFPSWQAEKPLPGMSQVRTHEGRTFYWCDECKHWRTSHSTLGDPANDIAKHNKLKPPADASASTKSYEGNMAEHLGDDEFAW